LKKIRRLIDVEAAEKATFHNPGRSRVFRFQAQEGRVQVEDFSSETLYGELILVKGHGPITTASFTAVATPGGFHQHLSHGSGCGAKEVRPTAMGDVRTAD